MDNNIDKGFVAESIIAIILARIVDGFVFPDKLPFIIWVPLCWIVLHLLFGRFFDKWSNKDIFGR